MANEKQAEFTKPGMAKEDAINACIELAKIHRSEFNERRKLEWKFVLTSLTLFVLMVVARLKDDPHVPFEKIPSHLIWLWMIIFLGYGLGFLARINTANAKNKEIAVSAEDAVFDLVRHGQIKDSFGTLQKEKPVPDWRVLKWCKVTSRGNPDWGAIYHILVLVFFGLVTAVLLTMPLD